MDEDNKAIRQLGNAVVNYRIGGEFRANIFRFRAGYGVNYKPLQSHEVTFGTTYSISGGAGVRYNNFYFDAGVIHDSGSGVYAPYLLNAGDNPTTAFDRTNLKVLFTLGITY